MKSRDRYKNAVSSEDFSVLRPGTHLPHPGTTSGRAALTLLGEWRLTIDGRPAAAPAYDKGRALLAFLAVENRWLTRARLGALFWPDSLNPRANLRAVLANLRTVLQEDDTSPCLLIRRDAISVSAGFAASLDLTTFLAVAPSCEGTNEIPCEAAHCASCLHRMEQAEAAYRGEFMEGFTLVGCPEFDEWLERQRSAQRHHALALRNRLADCHARRSDVPRALVFARRALQIDPWDESVMRRLMRLLTASGQRSAAMAEYETWRSLLMREIGIQPEAATRETARQILAGEGGPAVAANKVRHVVVLHVEMELGVAEPLEAERYIVSLDAVFDAALARWSAHRRTPTGLPLCAVFGLADDGTQAPRHALCAALEIVALPEFARARVGICEGRALIDQNATVVLARSTLPPLAQRLALCGEPGEVIVAASLSGGHIPGADFVPLPRRRFRGLAGEYDLCRLVATMGHQP